MTIVRSTQTAPLAVLGDQVRLLLRSSDSPHRMTAMTVEVQPGAGVPPHRHRQEEEGYFVLAGELRLTIDDQQHVLRPGDFGHVRPGTVHGYWNTTAEPVRFLAWTVGGPIDEFFVAMSERVRTLPNDAPAMMELMERYGVQMAGEIG